MGLVLNAHCDACKYEAVVQLGDGIHLATADHYHWPHACLNCGNVVTVDLKKSPPTCQICKSNSVIAYEANRVHKVNASEADYVEAHKELVTKRHYCPHCSKAKLTFAGVAVLA